MGYKQSTTECRNLLSHCRAFGNESARVIREYLKKEMSAVSTYRKKTIRILLKKEKTNILLSQSFGQRRFQNGILKEFNPRLKRFHNCRVIKN